MLKLPFVRSAKNFVIAFLMLPACPWSSLATDAASWPSVVNSCNTFSCDGDCGGGEGEGAGSGGGEGASFGGGGVGGGIGDSLFSSGSVPTPGGHNASLSPHDRVGGDGDGECGDGGGLGDLAGGGQGGVRGFVIDHP